MLHARPTGGASWCWNYTRPTDGKGDTIVYGPFPLIGLSEARDLHDAARKLVLTGIDPKERAREEKRATADTFAQVAERYLAKQTQLRPRTIAKARWQLREFLNPEIGQKPINEISAKQLLAALRKIEARGKIETAHKTKELAGRIFGFAVAEGIAEHNVAADLKQALAPRPDAHLAALTDPVKVSALLQAIEGYDGQPATHAALRLAPHIFLRPGELRGGRWREIDWTGALWRIPADRMKMGREHLVPLSRQSLAILRELESITGREEYMFPAIGRRRRAISDGTLGAALRGLGYSSDVHTPHGFRTTASTLLHERGYESRDIELQLAHADTNKIRGIYNRAERIKERTKMMQQWSDYLDSLRASGIVVAIGRK